MKTNHAPFWRTRKAVSRLPLTYQLAAAALGGAIAVFVLQRALHGVALNDPLTQGALPYHAHNRQSHADDTIPQHPKPIVVVAAGLPRTGSTWVYNVLRILMRMRDPNTVAGWYADLIAIWKNHKTGKYDNMKVSWLDAYKSLNTSLLLKMHGPGPFKLFSRGTPLGIAADLTVITHRDLRSEVRSWVYQNWNSSIHSGDIAKTPFGNPAEWVRVAQHILNERRTTLASVGEGRYLDIRYEDWTGQDIDAQIKVIEAMAAELDWDFSYDELRAAAVEAARLEAPANGAVLMYNPVNKLHPGHTRVDASNPAFQNALEQGYKAITEQSECHEFLKSKHYI